MKRDLLKLIVTVIVGLLLIGCGSSGRKVSSASGAGGITPTAIVSPTPTATSPTDNNNSDNNGSDNNDSGSNNTVTTDTSDPLPF